MRPIVLIGTGAFLVRALPVLAGGGLLGILGYDDGVYYASAAALVHGVVPYRDFLLLHPPGIVLALSPFALLGTVIGDPAGFAMARLAMMLLGAANAALVTVIAGRYGRHLGLAAGLVYALWSTASSAERSTDLHAVQNTLLLLALLALSRTRPTVRRAAVAGIAVGLATSVQLWQGASAIVLLWWLAARARDQGLRMRTAAAYAAGAGIAFSVICIPFLLGAPADMVRYTLLDQIGRPAMDVGTVDRLRALEGLPQLRQLPPPLQALVPDSLVLAAAALALALLITTARARPWARPWAVLAIAQAALVLLMPSFFNDYASLVAPASALVLGTGLASAAARFAGRAGWGQAWAAIGVLSVVLAGVSLAHLEGDRLPLAELERDLADARCVASDTPALLVLTSAMRRDLDAGCAIVLDPAGIQFDTDRGRLVSGNMTVARRAAPGYQAAIEAWLTSGDAALFVRRSADALSPATEDAVDRKLPRRLQRGIVTVQLAPAP